MPELTKAETLKVVDALPGPLVAAMEDMEGGFIIAGGFIRDTLMGEKPNDIDIWATPQHGTNAALELWANESGYSWDGTQGLYGKSRKFHPKGGGFILDFVNLVHKDMAGVMMGFDLQCCQGAVRLTRKGWAGKCAEGFRAGLNGKLLEKTATVPFVGAIRLKKFLERGWTMGKSLEGTPGVEKLTSPTTFNDIQRNPQVACWAIGDFDYLR